MRAIRDGAANISPARIDDAGFARSATPGARQAGAR
jgi:hypothetical protein